MTFLITPNTSLFCRTTAPCGTDPLSGARRNTRAPAFAFQSSILRSPCCPSADWVSASCTRQTRKFILNTFQKQAKGTNLEDYSSFPIDTAECVSDKIIFYYWNGNISCVILFPTHSTVSTGHACYIRVADWRHSHGKLCRTSVLFS